MSKENKKAAVAKALEESKLKAKSIFRKVNVYSEMQRTETGKYAAECGATNAII